MRGECQKKLLIGGEKQFTLTLFLPMFEKTLYSIDNCIAREIVSIFEKKILFMNNSD
jgi:hypothetical protein